MHTDWIVIGAGVSGARLTHHLSDAGFQVVVLEKSRGLGGRLCHRRSEYGRFLHGLQYVHLRDKRSLQIMEPWLRAPHAHRVGHLGFVEMNGTMFAANHAQRFQFFPETSAFCRAWTENAKVHRQTRVHSIEFDGAYWTVTTENQQYTAPYLASSIPFSQLLKIVPSALMNQLHQDHDVEESPSCSVMFRTLMTHQLPNDWKGVFFEADSDGPVRFLLEQASGPQNWTAILDGEWVEEHWKAPEAVVLQSVLEQLSSVFSICLSQQDLEWHNVHWWKYAFSTPQSSHIQVYPDWHLTLVGDGVSHCGRGFEAALLSAESAAEQAIEMAQINRIS